MNTRSGRWTASIFVIPCVGLALASGCASSRVGVSASALPAFSGPPADRARVVADLQKKMAAADYQMDEFDEMVMRTDMEGAQLGTFLAAVKARAAKLAEWEAGAAGKKRAELRDKLAKARSAADLAAGQAIRKELDPVEEEYGAFRCRIRAEVMAVMTLDQQRDWAAYVLWGHWGQFSGRFQNLALTEKQEDEARRIVRDEMNRVVGPKTVADDPYLKALRARGNEDVRAPIVKRIAKEVLTADQRKGLGD